MFRLDEIHIAVRYFNQFLYHASVEIIRIVLTYFILKTKLNLRILKQPIEWFVA